MKEIKKNIIFKTLTIVLVISLITPSIVKFVHVFENHKHEVCTSKQQKHLHEIDVDCEFYKFKVSNNFDFKILNFSLFSIEDNYKSFHSHYQFITEYQRLSFVLRGPPYLV